MTMSKSKEIASRVAAGELVLRLELTTGEENISLSQIVRELDEIIFNAENCRRRLREELVKGQDAKRLDV